ncbi:TonB-dependent receptor [Sphingopyxis sp.]|uniref:TonB-dependent receptor n=1 Tax=Sphingopyxis sp. TaxID=1908224 RepID=UPI003F6EA489
MKAQFKASVAAVALAGAPIAVFVPAYAQGTSGDVAPAQERTEGGAPETVGIGEIVVTAQKREQRLNDVGLSVSVASGEQIQNAGITDAADLGAIVPGFTASTSVFGPPVFSLRGVNFNSFQASAPPTVSTYVDEAALPYPIMGQGLFLDIERVEVLKGPQGTLFGQNATGGSINVIAAKPTADLSAGFRLDANHWGEVNAEGFVSGPLSDTLRGRLAVQTSQGGGWQRGYFLNDQKNGSQNKLAGRLLLDWTPTERLTISVNLNASRDRSEQQQAQAFLILPAVPAGAPPAFLDYANNLPDDARDADFDQGFDTRADSHTYQAVLRGDYELTDELSLTSITNYVETRFRSPHDQDGTAVNTQQGLAFADIQSINQEIRLSGAFPSAGVNFVIGGSYGDDDITEGVFNNYAAYSGFPPNSPAEWRYDLTQKAKAVFGSIDVEVTPGLTLTAGARYTDTEQSIFGCTFDRGGTPGIRGIPQFIVSGINPALAAAYVSGGCITIDDSGPNPTFLPVFADQTQKENNLAWRGAVNYKPSDDVLLYASVSRGFKAGTYPVIVNLFDSAIQPVGQEKLTSYEVGTKLTLADNRVQLNMAAFHYDYVDKQFFTFLPVLGGALVTATLVNIPKSTVDGLEFDITAEPVEGLRITGGATYIKTEVKDYVNVDFAGRPLIASGREFNYAPPWSANLDAEYSVPSSGSIRPFIGGSVTYRARTFADLGEAAYSRLPAYTLFDARIGIESDDGWRLALYGRNLTNEYYWNSVASAGDGAVRFAGEPRTFGANLSYRF